MKQSPYFLKVFEMGPTTIGRLVDQIPTGRHDEALQKDRFTVREIVAHMADCEEVFFARIQKAVANSSVTIPGFDPGDRAAEQAYSTKDVQSQLALFRDRRRATVAFLDALRDEDWESYYRHADWGDMTVLKQAHLMMGHDLYHIEQLTEYLGGKTSATW